MRNRDVRTSEVSTSAVYTGVACTGVVNTSVSIFAAANKFHNDGRSKADNPALLISFA